MTSPAEPKGMTPSVDDLWLDYEQGKERGHSPELVFKRIVGAALSPSHTPANELTWVIEKGSPAEYFVGFDYGAGRWSADFAEALRFPSKERAQEFMKVDEAVFAIFNDAVRVEEHMICGGPSHTPAERMEPLDEVCPTCKAIPGMPCVGAFGKQAIQIHPARINKANRRKPAAPTPPKAPEGPETPALKPHCYFCRDVLTTFGGLMFSPPDDGPAAESNVKKYHVCASCWPTLLAAALASTPQAGWVTVEERLPQDGDEVIAAWQRGDTGTRILTMSDFDRGQFFNAWSFPCRVTHWMPLPAAPVAAHPEAEKDKP